MMRFVLIAAGGLVTCATASAQYPMSPYYQPPAAMPNVYNPANQPLSPYLNLLRGGSPAVNYYYGVRPGTVGGTGQGLGAPFTAGGGQRALFFPQMASAPDPLQPREAAPGSVLPPAGHPTVFNSTGGYFPSPNNRGGMRPGLAGVGTTRR
ncbi:hypothetical protein GobsT_29290 [Gemmata obscuriglobus]|uniref:Translation initiation factor IF-2 n=1 Tax=Gemmata obscuriglobus TaxID=114 RepID=A0A2Z3H7A3_9BACT|nr:hypothetical protein [Gemmata obscuriglobus]AWM38845.1 hypothetical protein C1280_18900 [Gemmata obscuriglobus]QEG28155.1 hypothetical protein GobsT_29290 [Gemmata obscuriglobus]VTS05845.1 unnamed protein product [Gemmata obscuriglobus UQM 2246]